MAYSRRTFYEANPKLCAAFVAAVDEAARFIAANKREAARIYIALAGVRMSEDEMMRMLNDPDTHYSSVPEGVMKYVDFMHEIRTLKAKPASWQDLFFPPIHGHPGS